MEVEVVVQLGKLQDHLDGLGLVVARETAMLPSFENAIAALEDQVRTDRIFPAVKSLIESLLLGQKNHCAVVLRLTLTTETALKHSTLDVSPHVGRIVTVKIDYRFGQRLTAEVRRVLKTWCGCRSAMARNLIKVLGVGHWSDYVNHFVEGNIWIVSQVAVC